MLGGQGHSRGALQLHETNAHGGLRSVCQVGNSEAIGRQEGGGVAPSQNPDWRLSRDTQSLDFGMEITIRGEMTQTQKDEYYMFSHTWP